jgi:hypothetical protein
MNETNCERGEGGATERHRQVRREERDRLGHTRGAERRREAMRGGGCHRGARGATKRRQRDSTGGTTECQIAQLPYLVLARLRQLTAYIIYSALLDGLLNLLDLPTVLELP